MREPKSTGINLVTRPTWRLWISGSKPVCTLARPTPCSGTGWEVTVICSPADMDVGIAMNAKRCQYIWKLKTTQQCTLTVYKWNPLLGYIGKVIAFCVPVLVMANLLQGVIILQLTFTGCGGALAWEMVHSWTLAFLWALTFVCVFILKFCLK